MEEVIRIGSIARTHGLKGELKLILDREHLPEGFQPKIIYLQHSPSPLPYFTSHFKLLNGRQAILKLEGINTLEVATTLLKKEVSVPANELGSSIEQDFSQLLGYQLIDSDGNVLGSITDILEMPMHQVAQIIYNGQEALIPIGGDALISIDNASRQIHVKIPDGLLDIYQ